MSGEIPYYRSALRTELERRCQKNPKYSLRAFARAMEFEPTVVSQILSGKRIPSLKTAKRLLDNLALSPDDHDAFIHSLAEVQRARGLGRMNRFFRRSGISAAPPARLGHDEFRVIADWYHYGILALSCTQGFRAKASWIARQLGISVIEAELAIERLEQVGLLSISASGEWTLTHAAFTTTDKAATTSALKLHQRQILNKSLESLDADPIERRSHSSMTLAIDPSKLPEAKRRIEAFTQELTQFLESGRRERVYELAISIFPLQKEGVQNES